MGKKTEIDKDLQKCLLQAKQKKPRYFAFVSKGQDGKLIVSKKKIKPGDISAAKKEVGGSKVFNGVCCGTGGANIVFELTDKEPSGGARIVKKIIAENAGLKLKPEFKVVQQLAQVNEDEPDEDIDINAELADQEDDETDEEENVQSPLSPPEAPPLRGQESAAEKEWKWRFEAIQKDLATVLKDQRGDHEKVRSVFELAQRQRKTDIANAVASLKACAQLVKLALAANDSREEDEDSKTAGLGNDEKQRKFFTDWMNGLTPELKFLKDGRPELFTRVAALLQRVRQSVGQQDWDEAANGYGEVEALLLEARKAATGEELSKLAALQKVTLGRWEAVQKGVSQDLKKVQDAMVQLLPQSADMAQKMNVVLDDFKNGLDVELKAGIASKDDNERQSHNGKALEIISEYSKYVSSNDVLTTIDEFPRFKPGLRKTLLTALTEMEKTLRS